MSQLCNRLVMAIEDAFPSICIRMYLADVEVEPIRHAAADAANESTGIQHRHVLR